MPDSWLNLFSNPVFHIYVWRMLKSFGPNQGDIKNKLMFGYILGSRLGQENFSISWPIHFTLILAEKNKVEYKQKQFLLKQLLDLPLVEQNLMIDWLRNKWCNYHSNKQSCIFQTFIYPNILVFEKVFLFNDLNRVQLICVCSILLTNYVVFIKHFWGTFLFLLSSYTKFGINSDI